MRKHSENVGLDSALIRAGMRGGFEAVLAAGMRLGLPSPDAVLDRAEWAKHPKQAAYLERVIEHIVEKERTGGR